MAFYVGESVHIKGTGIIGTIIEAAPKSDYYCIDLTGDDEGIMFEFGTRLEPARALDYVYDEKEGGDK